MRPCPARLPAFRSRPSPRRRCHARPRRSGAVPPLGPARASQGATAVLGLAEQCGLGAGRTSGKHAARSGRDTGPMPGSTNAAAARKPCSRNVSDQNSTLRDGVGSRAGNPAPPSRRASGIACSAAPAPARLGAELFQAQPLRELVAVGGIDIAIPEMRAEARRAARSKMMSVSGPRLARRRNHRWRTGPGTGLRTNLEADPQRPR